MLAKDVPRTLFLDGIVQSEVGRAAQFAANPNDTSGIVQLERTTY